MRLPNIKKCVLALALVSLSAYSWKFYRDGHFGVVQVQNIPSFPKRWRQVQVHNDSLGFPKRRLERMYFLHSKTWPGSVRKNQPTAPPARSERRRQHDTEAASTVFEQRRQRYREACAETAASPYFRPSGINRASFLQVDNLAYCSIAKTGSTLWKRILYYIRTNQTGPFHNTRTKSIHLVTRKLRTFADGVRGNDVKTVVLVREPYTRLLSAYVDKLFRPTLGSGNPSTGRQIRTLSYIYILSDADRDDICSSHVTFPEFIRYFIDSETGLAPAIQRDPHFIPQSQHCGFCTGLKEQDVRSYWDYRQVVPQRPDGSNHGSHCADNGKGQRNCSEEWRSGFVHHFIAKTEDLSHDTLAVFELTNLISRLPPNLDMDVGQRRNDIKLTIEKVFKKVLEKSRTMPCVSKEEVLRRHWKTFQIRGMLSKRELFPLPSAAADVIGMADFQALALSAFDRSQKDPDLKKNRRIAMAEAYGMVTLEDRNTLRAIFSRDFQLFGYPATIPEVFPENDEFPLERYRFFDIFDNATSSKDLASLIKNNLKN